MQHFWIAKEQMGPLLPRHLAYVASGRRQVDLTLGDIWTGEERLLRVRLRKSTLYLKTQDCRPSGFRCAQRYRERLTVGGELPLLQHEANTIRSFLATGIVAPDYLHQPIEDCGSHAFLRLR